MRARRGDLAKAMVEADVSRPALGRILDVSRPTATKLVKGEDVTRHLAIATATVLGREVSELFDESPVTKEAA